MKTENLSLSTGDRIALMISLSTMLASGITIIEALNSLLEDAKGNQKKIISTWIEDITQGKRLYTSMAKFPNLFDNVTVNLVRAAEEAGTLDSTLKQVKENMEKEAEFIDKIKSALFYPLFIFVIFIGVLGMILIVVIPKISTVFSRLKVNIPLPTKIMIFVSDLILKNTIPFIIGSVIIITLIIILLKVKRRFFLQLFFSLPIVSQLVIQIDLVSFTRSLAMLLNSGIIINTAMEICEEIVLNKKVLKMIKDSQVTILAGKKLSEGLRINKKIIPSIMIRIIESGEKSGSLYKSLLDVSSYLDFEVSKSLKTLTVMIEPVMLVVVGVLVGGMMISIIAPIYGMIGQVGSR